ncbi:hypothetical protein [Endozoicomonas sp. SCSIO W0465]|uniref:hypothetical protein n=1 Tax=Endozoicomonas sp. SCSIO W0465 TaxID=2918516 RepID=UPI00207630CE|nr:hypothetical protein [Endozoicomonas sp. SCSIO W0465]USE34987.1 hypothetical protein MJO57_23125 [Endozoicomonas sp. SCSIO W0465]
MQEDKKIHQSNQDLSITAEQRPSRHRTTGTGPKSVSKPAATTKRGGAGHLVSGVLFVLLAGISAGGYWQVTELQKELKDTRQELQATRDQLGLVTGQVSQTGETINQSDSIFRSELKVVNSEIRKLWDVSNKRNRQWINENKEKIEQGAKTVDLAVKQSDAAKRSSEQAVSKLDELDQMMKAITTEQLVANSGMINRVEALKAEVDGLKNTLSTQQSVQQQIKSSAQTQEELSKKLSAFQSQVSLRLQQLENTMRDLGNPEDKGLTIQ